MAREKKSPDDKRTETRERLWPNSEAAIWTPVNPEVQGYARITRLMPLIMMLIGKICGKGGNPASVYLDLWCRDMGQSLITINDEEEFAYAAGYDSRRTVRSWKERMSKLIELGFIKAQREHNREYGQVLLLNPLAVIAKLKKEGVIDDEAWWNAFHARASAIRAEMPKAAVLDFEKAA